MTYKNNQVFYVTFIVSDAETLKISFVQSLKIAMYNLTDDAQCNFTDGELTCALEKYLNEECIPTGFHANIVNWWPF